MSFLKKLIRKMLSEQERRELKATVRYYKNLPYSISRKQRFKILSEKVGSVDIISFPKKHVFVGYYDIAPDSPYNNNQILLHLLSIDAEAGKSSIDLAVYDINTRELNIFYTTHAWCWQQGARLRWGSKKGIVYFNDVQSERKYCCKKYNIEENRVIKTIPAPLYDICSNEKYGISINFERLQRLRPGYGYMCFGETKQECAPVDDGLFYIDLQNGKSKLLISLRELAESASNAMNCQNYINHVSISPNGRYIMFFHILVVDLAPGWKATLCVYDLEENKLIRLEDEDQVSHYTWKDNENILITGINLKTHTGFYREYTVATGAYRELENQNLHRDGHPTYSRAFNGFYGDTYPNNQYVQSFFMYGNDNKYEKLVDLFSDPRLFNEKRCDLHPHYFCGRESIALDSTFENKKREVVVVNMRRKD